MKRWWAALGVALLGWTAALTAADEGMSKARDLYAAAAYEDALTVLNALGADARAADGPAIDQYRAFCLLALGRQDDAQKAIEAVVSASPQYKPADAEVSPRIRAAFSDVRRRMLPAIIQTRYGAAKAAFDRKEAGASAAFDQVLVLLADPDVAAAASQPPLADLRMLATGFRDLSAPPPEPPPLPVAKAAPVEVPVPAAVSGPVRGRVYSAADPDVTGPVALRQTIPPFQLQTPLTPGQGLLEIVIGEDGDVVSAQMKMPVFPRYDTMLIDAARTWRFKPATMQGVPVLYRKIIVVNVKR